MARLRSWVRNCAWALAGCGLALAWTERVRAGEDGPVAQSVPAVAGWSLAALLELAQENNPDLAIARAQADIVRGHLIQAGLYPNPTFMWEFEDVGTPGHRAGLGNEGPFIGQQFVTAGKIKLAVRAAEAGVSMADWQAVTRWYDIITRLRMAYFDLATAEREVQTQEEIVRIALEGLEAAQKLLKAGTGTRPDVLRAQVELADQRTRVAVASQRRLAAWKTLAVAVGMSHLEPQPLSEKLEAAAPVFQWEPTLALVLQRSSEVQTAQAAVLQAEQLLLRARAERVSNVDVAVRPLYSFGDQRAEVTATVGVSLPLWNRNQGNIVAAQAEVGRTLADARGVELRLADRLAAAFERYQSARLLVESYGKEILPDAQESLGLIRKGYEAGDAKYDFTTVLQAQRTLAQARLDYVRAQGQLWKAVSEIRGLVQDEDCPIRGGCH